jgi:excisionase family DNA binding protein
MTERWMHRHEAAAYLRLGVSTFDNLVREGTIKKYKMTGRRRVLFDREELDAYVRANQPEQS